MNQEMPLAKQEHDKEDILREATALVNRIELRSTDGSWKSTVHVGFRRDQSIAFFFGAEPVYQFNVQHQFRRAYFNGLLLKAENGKIVQLRRQREAGQLMLLRKQWNSHQQEEFLRVLQHDLMHLKDLGQSGMLEICGTVVEGGTAEELLLSILDWIEVHVVDIQIANVPNVAG